MARARRTARSRVAKGAVKAREAAAPTPAGTFPGIGRSLPFIKMNDRPPKPRRRGVTEIRGPYYTPMGKRYLQDVLETMGAYVDALKFAGGSFSLMPRRGGAEAFDPPPPPHRPGPPRGAPASP